MKRFIGFMVCAVAGLGIWYSLLKMQPTEKSLASSDASLTPQMRTAVSSLGRLEPASRILKLNAGSSAMPSIVERLHGQEGERVTAGQKLATLESYNVAAANLKQAEAGYALAIARLQQVQAGVQEGTIGAAAAVLASAEADLKTKRRELQRFEKLWESNSVSEADLEAQRLTVEIAIASRDRAKEELSALREVRPTDLAVAEADVANALAAIAVATAQLEDAVVVSPIDGTILRIHTFEGESIDSDGILEIANLDAMQAVAEIFEGDVPLVRIGQKARIWTDALEDEFCGRVAQIGFLVGRKDVLNNDPILDTDARIVEVRIDIDQPSQVLKRLSNAQVQIEIELGKPSELPKSSAPAHKNVMNDAHNAANEAKEPMNEGGS